MDLCVTIFDLNKYFLSVRMEIKNEKYYLKINFNYVVWNTTK